MTQNAPVLLLEGTAEPGDARRGWSRRVHRDCPSDMGIWPMLGVLNSVEPKGWLWGVENRGPRSSNYSIQLGMDQCRSAC